MFPRMFNPDILPWETDPAEWGLCLVPARNLQVWIEQELLREIARSKDLEPSYDKRHEILVTMGGKVGNFLAEHPEMVMDRKVRALQLTMCPLTMRIGFFGGDVFVFRPRPVFEG